MANLHKKGKFFFSTLCFLFIFASSSSSTRVFSSSVSSLPIEKDHEPEIVLDRNQVQLQKLEELVKNLTEIVDRLESKLLEALPRPHKALKEKKLALQDKNEKIDKRIEEEEEEGFEGKSAAESDGERMRAVSVMRYSPFWSERFQFMSAVKLDSEATCINVLPFRDYEGVSKYVAVGDERGRVYVFLRNGDVSVEFYTSEESPITAMLSYLSVYKNETVIVTGHKNGVILLHKVWEASNGEDWSSLLVEKNVRQFVSVGNGNGDVGHLAITFLDVHHIGRNKYILSTDESGKIRVFRENGTVYGSVMPSSKPLAFLKQRLLFLTESGAGSLDLRNMKVRESECEGLNRSVAKNYVFDATERSKAYGITSDGNLIHVLLLGDIMNFKCRVRSKRKLDIEEPLVFQAIRGYLLIVNQEKVFVYNVSSQHYVRVGGPRLLFFAGLDDIKSSFLNYQAVDVENNQRRVIPLIASDRDKLVVLGLGDGYVGMYRSNLPVFKGEFSTMLWTSPVLFFILFLFGAWHFFAKKKEVLTSWGPDSGDRSFGDASSRSGDMMDLGSGSLRGPSRSYVSPTRYSGGAATSSFRPSSAADHNNSRPTSVDPNCRTASELKFRGSI